MTFDWTKERIEILTELWSMGHSASEVAKQLGEGVSRCAVIGKTRRLKLPLRAGKHGGKRVMSLAPKSVKAPEPAPKLSEPIVEPEALILDDGSHVTVRTVNDRMCRWPIGDPQDADFHFCGHRPKSQSPYCEEHARKAFQPATHIRRESDAG